MNDVRRGRIGTHPEPYVRLGNLYFVPVVPQRLNFAVLVQQAVARMEASALGALNEEDLIAVSLPPSVRSHVEAAIDKLPAVSLVITSVARSSGSDYREVFPVTPCDGGIEAMRIATERRIPLELIDCEVSPALLARRSCLKGHDFCDDAAALVWGCEEYLRLIRPYVSQPPARFEPVATWRENHMVRRLRDLQPRYRRVLVVCEAAHVDALMSLLVSPRGRFEDFHLDSPQPGFDVWQPSLPILLQYLDDFPKLVELYEKARVRQEGSRFDKQTALFQVVINTDQDANLQFSTRQHQAFVKYLQNMVKLSGRVSPTPYQVFECLAGCFGNAFAERVDHNLIEYVDQINVEKVQRSPKPTENGYWLSTKVREPARFFVGRSCNPNSAWYVPSPELPPATQPLPAPAAKQSVTWGLYDRYLNKMRRKAYELTFRVTVERQSSLFRGMMESGIDRQRTLGSFWRGASLLYVKRDNRRRDAVDPADAPIVWLFDPKKDKPLHLEWTYIMGDPTGVRFLNTVYYLAEERILYSEPDRAKETGLRRTVRLRRVCAMISFVDRNLDLEDVRKHFGKSLDKRVPRGPMPFHLGYGKQTRWSDRVLLFALKHANKSIVCIAPPDFAISDIVRLNAHEAGKSIIRVSLGRFGQDERRRLSQGYSLDLPWVFAETSLENAQRTMAVYGDIMKRFWD